jgi:hypothetical protein
MTITREVAAGIDALRRYLDDVGFQQIYKFIASVNLYGITPSLITGVTGRDAKRFFDVVLADHHDLGVLQCLMFGRPAERQGLSDGERAVADALVAAGLLGMDGDTVVPAGHQLISAFGLDLLIDRRIHFAGEGIHDVYIGPDSYWMLYYVDAAAIRREHRVVDLCTGTGIAALYLSLFSDRVLATDIGDVPLSLVPMNRRLNRKDLQVEIRNEDLRDTLHGGERFDVLTCNPPFVAFPPGIDGSLYAQGPDSDGLGYMRRIIERLPDVLNAGGSAYLVADLVGDQREPYFLHDLQGYAKAGSTSIDVYIDSVVDAEAQIEPLSTYLALIHRGRDRAQIATELERFQKEVLHAERYYLATVRLRTAATRPEVRVMRRYPVPARRPVESWPQILLHR